MITSQKNIVQRALGHVVPVVFIPVVISGAIWPHGGERHCFIRLADGKREHRLDLCRQLEQFF